MDDDGVRPVRVVPVGDRSPRVARAVAVIVAAIALATLKPWSGDEASPVVGDGSTTARTGGEADYGAPDGSVAAPPTDQPTALRQCFALPDWRIYAIEQGAGDTIRTWQAVEPVAATGPLDRSLPVVRVPGSRTLALGFCGPSGAGGPASIEDVEAWRVTERGAEPVRLDPMRTLAPPDPDEGRLWLPPRTSGTRPDRWQAGRYAFAIRRVSASDDWFAVEVGAPSPGAGG